MTGFTIAEIASSLGSDATGDTSIRVFAVREPSEAGPGDLAIALYPQFVEALGQGSARAAILCPGTNWQDLGLEAAIFVREPQLDFARLTHVFLPPRQVEPGIHPTAVVDPTARVGNNVSIGPFTQIEADVEIGENSVFSGHCTLGPDTRIGPGACIRSGVRIGPGVRTGSNFVCQSNTVIGADGFSYVTPSPDSIRNAKATGHVVPPDPDVPIVKINSLGGIVIGDDVEIGANCTIDRATISRTVIGDGTKIDNLVHIAHNVQIGRNCLICGLVAMGGSVRLGDRVFLGGHVGVGDHVNVGSDVMVGGMSAVISHVPSGRIMMGNPAMKMNLNIDAYKALRRLPRLAKRVRNLERLASAGGNDSND
ncbi:MAG: UDP-3-O-(3-hydroxymyristoyl)glucosamine N-acyltransferase [Rhodobacteraceae bacterium]|nr:UDP-3-O-(3-hydroxymyristoyl)glucosamine N-acyltransferase [Paracoccaceae bacterium]